MRQDQNQQLTISVPFHRNNDLILERLMATHTFLTLLTCALTFRARTKRNESTTRNNKNQRLEWFAAEDDVRLCRLKGKSYEQCQNYIRVLKMSSHDSLLVCGTNAYKPRCRTYFVTVSTLSDARSFARRSYSVCLAARARLSRLHDPSRSEISFIIEFAPSHCALQIQLRRIARRSCCCCCCCLPQTTR